MEFVQKKSLSGGKRVVIENARVWKWNKLPNAESIQYEGEFVSGQTIHVEGGTITKITNTSSDGESKSNNDIVIDAKECLVLPGLQDAHIHVAMMAQSRYYIDLRDCFSIEDLIQTIKTALSSNPIFTELPFIVGVNWDQSQLGRLPSRKDLDALPTDKPMFLWRACWHIGVANTAALKLANLLNTETDELADHSQANIPGGGIDLEVDTFRPTGILRENSVNGVVSAFNTYQTTAQKVRFIREGLQICLSQGLTTVQTNDEYYSEVYHDLQAKNELPIRVLLTPSHNTEVRQLSPHSLHNPTTGIIDVSCRLAQERVKIFSDGSLGAETAALSIRDDSSGEFKGILMQSHEQLVDMLRLANERQFRVEIHAIGDAAADHVISGLEAIEKESSDNNSSCLHRPILTHCQVLSPSIIDRMRRLNVIANVQPSFVPTDMRWVRERLRDNQLQSSYAWKTLLCQGVMVAGGSDAPIEDPNPFTGMHDAIIRSNYHRSNTTEIDVFRPEEALTFDEALGIYTYGAAYAAGYEHIFGTLASGYAADLVIVDASIVTDHKKLLDLQPDLVMVGGEVEFIRTNTSSSALPEIIYGIDVVKHSAIHTVENTSIRSERLPEKTAGLPGKNGAYAGGVMYCTEIESTEGGRKKTKKVNTYGFNDLRCACLLVGKYCH